MSLALSLSLRLLLLDRVWTREAQRASADATRDQERVAQLGAVVDEMDGLLKECRDAAEQMAAIAERTRPLLQERFDAMVHEATDRGISEARIRSVFERLQHHVDDRAGGDAVTYVERATGVLRDRADAEVAELRAEHTRIVGGSASDGDMSAETQEAVAAAAIGAGLLLGPEAAGAVIVVAEIVDCLS